MTKPVPESLAAPPARTLRAGPAIAVLLAAAFTVVLNETAMGVAIPDIMDEFGVSAASAQWLTTAFMLTMAVVIPVTGVLLQRLPLRTAFALSLGFFAVGSLLASIAPVFGLLVAARVIQALGTAIMLPLLFTTAIQLVAPERQGRTMGLVTVVTAAAPALGPMASGLVVSGLGWRWVFLLALAVAGLVFVIGVTVLRTVVAPIAARFDVLSVVLSAVGFSGVIYGLASIGESASARPSIPVWVPLVVGAAALVALVLRQVSLRDTDRVLLDVRVFANRPFAVATVLIVVVSVALFGSLILLPLYLQTVLGMPAYVAGLALLPGGLLSGILAPFAGIAFDRVGPRGLVLVGAIIVTGAMIAFSTLGAETALAFVIAVHCLLSVGTALMMTPLMTTALGSVPPERYSHASAIVTTLQQVSGAAGTALFITVFSLMSSGAAVAPASAGSEGVGGAFGVGAGFAAIGILLAFFVRRPAAGGRTPAEAA